MSASRPISTSSCVIYRGFNRKSRKIKGMDAGLTTTIVSTGGAVIVGVFGMFFTANQLGRRIDDLRADTNSRMKELGDDLKDLRNEFTSFKDMVNGKFAALDLDIAKFMDKRP